MSEIDMSTIAPPWVEYPETDPTWGGWRQGYSEAWLVDVWLPFWRGLSAAEREQYLEKWPAPSDEWSFYVTVAWVGDE
jgi:hypothetical protein